MDRQQAGNTQAGSSAQGRSGDAMHQVKDTAQQAANTAKEKASEAADQVKQKASEVSRNVTEQVSATMDEAKRKVEEQASEQKHHLADQIEGVAQALHRAGDGLEEGEQGNLGSYADTAAEQLTNLSNYLREHDLNQILDDARRYARQQPEIFYMGAMVAGFLAGRFFRSSAPQPRYSDMYESGYGPNYGPSYGSTYGSGYSSGEYGPTYGSEYWRGEGSSYGAGYGSGQSTSQRTYRQGTYPQGAYRQGATEDTATSQPAVSRSEDEELYSGPEAAAWTPSEQARLARSEGADDEGARSGNE